MSEQLDCETGLTRRAFLERLGLSAAGLVVGWDAWAGKPTSEPGGAVGEKPKAASVMEEMSATGLNPNVFVHVAASGLVSVVCHRSEMGQGIRSSLPVLPPSSLQAQLFLRLLRSC